MTQLIMLGLNTKFLPFNSISVLDNSNKNNHHHHH